MAWKQIHSIAAGRGKVGKQPALLALVSIHSSVSSKYQILQPLVCHFVPVKAVWAQLVPGTPLWCKVNSNWGRGGSVCMAQAFQACRV